MQEDVDGSGVAAEESPLPKLKDLCEPIQLLIKLKEDHGLSYADIAKYMGEMTEHSPDRVKIYRWCKLHTVPSWPEGQSIFDMCQLLTIVSGKVGRIKGLSTSEIMDELDELMA